MPTDKTNGLGSVIDTSTLGPVRAEPNALAFRAKVGREALIAATAIDPSPEVRHYGRWVAEHACDEALAKLGRLLK